MELTPIERTKLINDIIEFETEWANTDLDLQLISLDAVGADTIDDAIGPWYPNYNILRDFDLEMLHSSWKDFMSVVAHKAHILDHGGV